MNSEPKLLSTLLRKRRSSIKNLEIVETQLIIRRSPNFQGLEDKRRRRAYWLLRPYRKQQIDLFRPTIRLKLRTWLPCIGPREDAIDHFRRDVDQYNREIQQYREDEQGITLAPSAVVHFKSKLYMSISELALKAQDPSSWRLETYISEEDTIWCNITTGEIS